MLLLPTTSLFLTIQHKTRKKHESQGENQWQNIRETLIRPASLGGGGDAQSFNPQKVMPRRPIRTPCPFFFPVTFLHAEWPIAGSADEAVPTSCQISPFIVRKHPCNGPYPVFSAQVKKQQIRVENANCLGFSHYALSGPSLHHPRALEKKWKRSRNGSHFTVLLGSPHSNCPD